MKTITSDILKVAKIASTNPIRPVLGCVCITDTHLVATDSFKLLEVTRTGHKLDKFPEVGKTSKKVKKIAVPILINAKKLLSKLKFNRNSTLPVLEEAILVNDSCGSIGIATTDLETVTTIEFKKITGHFPGYKQIMPKDNHVSSITVDVNYLIELLTAFKGGTNPYVTLEFRGVEKPLVLIGISELNKNKKGLLMPAKI